MLQSKGGPSAGADGRVYRCVLTPNREDRSRFVALVGYEATSSWGFDHVLRPVRRVYQWVTDPEGTERFLCVRVTRLRWKDLQPGQAHVEMRDAWLQHVKEQKARMRVTLSPDVARYVQNADHLVEAQIGGGS